jgi:hypothetical protein
MFGTGRPVRVLGCEDGGTMPHRLKVIEQNTPTVRDIISQLANAEAKEIQRLKEEMSKKKNKKK